jgi:hypothetical protein
MPSVPQSLLWISLVVLWLFVLVPMLISKRDAVRRTSDVALATRVLNSTSSARRLKKNKPADGHRSDPDWQPVDEVDDDLDDQSSEKAVVVMAAAKIEPEPDYLDVDVVELDSGALPVGGGAVSKPTAEPVATAEPEPQPQAEPEPEPEPVAGGETSSDFEDDDAPDEDDEDDAAAQYETDEDTSGLEPEDEPASAKTPSASRRRTFESKTAAAVSVRKYRFRKRVLMAMSLILIAMTTTSVTVWPAGWWACGVAGVLTILYLGYLRRQTRIEEQLRRRRMQRMARSRVGVQNTADRDHVDMPSRLRRPGAAVLEIDDEDPIFEHLEYAPGPMEYHLPRAAGQ